MKRTKQELQKLINELVRLKDAERARIKNVPESTEWKMKSTSLQNISTPKTSD